MLSRARTSVAAMVLGGVTATAQPQANPDAQLIEQFRQRVQAYADLRAKLEQGHAALQQTRQPAEIRAAQDALAWKIRAARADAKHGNIFTPEIRALFRRLMYPETAGSKRADTKAALEDDAPNPRAITLQVNATYPEDQPRPTVPPNLLKTLPELPEDLEYRIIGRHLILRDARANLIVDFISNAIR